MHGEFLIVLKEKMSESKGQFLDIRALKKFGFQPLHFRYFCLCTHYRKQLNFSLKALGGVKNIFENLKKNVIDLRKDVQLAVCHAKLVDQYQRDFEDIISDDLNSPVAVSILWKVVEDIYLSGREELKLLLQFNEILGLSIDSFRQKELPQMYRDLIKHREKARMKKNWSKADRIRKFLKNMEFT